MPAIDDAAARSGTPETRRIKLAPPHKRADAPGQSRFETAAFLDRYEALDGYTTPDEGVTEDEAKLRRILLIVGSTLLIAGLLLAVYAWVWS